MQAVVLAAGKGTRMRSKHPKVLHPVLGEPLLQHVLKTLASLGVKTPRVVVGNGGREVCSFLEACRQSIGIRPAAVWQRAQRGTGHAVMQARASLKGSGEVLVWPGDMPLLESRTLGNFIRAHRKAKSTASVLSSIQDDPAGYGRILRNGRRFYAIREELDATPAERRVREVNSGVYLFETKALFDALGKIRPENRKKELYLTDVIAVLAKRGKRVEAFPLAGSEEGSGINNRKDLAKVTKLMNQREMERHMERGVTVVAPEQTVIESGVKIGPDTTVYPWTFIEKGVKIGKDCQIGPFAKIRSGTVIGDGAVIGSFVEVNRSKIGKAVAAKHLAYLGDADVGEGTNIGAGVITANFDGRKKQKSRIGKKNFLGANTVLVAPAVLPDGVKTGAGSVITGGQKIKKGEVLVGIPARPLTKKKKRKK